VSDTIEIPNWPVIEADLATNHHGSVNARVRLPDGETPTLSAPELAQAREQVLELVTGYAREKVGRAVRLQVSDPDGSWLLGVGLDGTRVALDSHPSPPASAPADPAIRPEMRVLDGGPPPASPAPAVGSDAAARRAPAPPLRGGLDRTRLHPLRRSPLARTLDRWREGLKDPEQRQEEDADRQLARRYTLTDTNYIVVASNKGGPGKTSISLLLGDALALRLPNQRVLAVDFNPGGGALGAAATEDRQAQFSLLQLHSDRAKIDRHSKLEPYVASLASGLDLLAVPPDPEHALEITPDHYEQLFQELLAPNYNLILLDTSPDITNRVTQWAQQHGTQLVIVTEQGYMSGKVVEHGLRYLLRQPAAGPDAEQATVVINKVIDDVRAGSLEETERALREHHAGPIIRIPWDLDLRAQIDLGDYTLDQVRRRSTRLPIKQLALEVTKRFI
jgi:MinD-like ATPase involved in chromosome partitioning or flagellar assembly